MTATSVIEVMASSNAIKKRAAKRRGVRNPVYEISAERDQSPRKVFLLLQWSSTIERSQTEPL